MYRIILYYNFKRIDHPEKFCAQHRDDCLKLKLKGRIYIAFEGINGTLAGSVEAIEEYKKYLCSIPHFEDTEFKDDDSSSLPFTKLIVKTRPEIVALKASIQVDPSKEQRNYLTPRQWKEALDSERNFILLDVRNRYESRVGHFEGAVLPAEENFFDFERWLDHTKLDKNKKVLMYCTGGIRCEKFSVLMRQKGFAKIYQLKGGIINYAKEEGDAHYRGKCFVFDDRLTIPVEKNQKEPLAQCDITGEPCDTYLNCANCDCNKLFICSQEGALKYEGCCSETCMQANKKRPFDANKIYEPTRKWYTYFEKKGMLS